MSLKFHRNLPEPYKVDTFASGHHLPIAMEARLIKNEHHYLNQEIVDPHFDDCLQAILEDPIRDSRALCHTTCIPVQFSTLVNISNLKVCSEYQDQLCAFSAWRKYEIGDFIWSLENNNYSIHYSSLSLRNL